MRAGVRMERDSDATNQALLISSKDPCASFWFLYGNSLAKIGTFFMGKKNPNLLSNDTLRFIIR